MRKACVLRTNFVFILPDRIKYDECRGAGVCCRRIFCHTLSLSLSHTHAATSTSHTHTQAYCEGACLMPFIRHFPQIHRHRSRRCEHRMFRAQSCGSCARIQADESIERFSIDCVGVVSVCCGCLHQHRTTQVERTDAGSRHSATCHYAPHEFCTDSTGSDDNTSYFALRQAQRVHRFTNYSIATIAMCLCGVREARAPIRNRSVCRHLPRVDGCLSMCLESKASHTFGTTQSTFRCAGEPCTCGMEEEVVFFSVHERNDFH